jgi:hypothetical protein
MLVSEGVLVVTAYAGHIAMRSVVKGSRQGMSSRGRFCFEDKCWYVALELQDRCMGTKGGPGRAHC